MTTMNPEIKARWVAALRSGEYEQGTYKLNRDGKFCCVGVLCDLAVEDGAAKWDAPHQATLGILDTDPTGERPRYAQTKTLSEFVARWAGIPGAESEMPSLVLDGAKYSPYTLNDVMKLSFAQIADLIEEQW